MSALLEKDQLCARITMAFDGNLGLLSEDILSPETTSGEVTLPTVSIDGKQLQATPVFKSYWEFASKRQNIFWERVHGRHPTFLNDPILSQYKFTNAYRASDRVSQFLIQQVIYKNDAPKDAENTFFRILLFKLFNKIETWCALEKAFGTVRLETFEFCAYDDFLTDLLRSGQSIYSAAYMMPSGASAFGQKYKHSNHLRLIEWMLDRRYPAKLKNTAKMGEGFQLLLAAPTIGNFLAYQYITDVNYSDLTDYSEQEFVVPGPGALDGIAKCFVDSRGVSAKSIIEYMAKSQNEYFDRYGLEFKDLWGRELQLIDCQNLFCEISKYARVAFPEISGVSDRTRIKQKFRPRGRLPRPMYPPSWGLNEKVESEFLGQFASKFPSPVVAHGIDETVVGSAPCLPAMARHVE